MIYILYIINIDAHAKGFCCKHNRSLSFAKILKYPPPLFIELRYKKSIYITACVCANSLVYCNTGKTFDTLCGISC